MDNFIPSHGELFDPNSEVSKKMAEMNAALNEPEPVIETAPSKNKDATLELIGEVKAHPDADRLDLVKILGFQCVTQKGLYKGGELVVYIRPDALLPVEPWTEEYRKYSPKRIKAVKLRGEWSEGIIVPIEILPQEVQAKLSQRFAPEGEGIGSDVSDILGVTHYEPPAPQDLKAKGGLPYGIPKTDEERFENWYKRLPFGEKVDIQLKIDGQSCSYYYDIKTEKFGVLGRSLELHEIFENNYTAHIERYDIKNKLTQFCLKENASICVRGESYGGGIQGSGINPHGQGPKGWAMFSVYLMDERRYAEKGDRFYFKNIAAELDLPIADMIEEDVELTQELLEKYSTGITQLNGKAFEGVVVKTKDTSFKIINKHYDSKK
jgi:RNA ligase (TIGR02306 family)